MKKDLKDIKTSGSYIFSDKKKSYSKWKLNWKSRGRDNKLFMVLWAFIMLYDLYSVVDSLFISHDSIDVVVITFVTLGVALAAFIINWKQGVK